MMEWNKLCITDINVANKRIILRTDLNSPNENGSVTNNERIVAAVPTIKYLLQHECHSIILISHSGEADGRPMQSCSLRPAMKELNKLLSSTCGLQVSVIDNFYDIYKDMICYYPELGSVLCFENIQFHLEEIRRSKDKREASKKGLIRFCRTLKRYGDVYVNDAFRYSHLAHISIAPPFYDVRVAGLQMKRELEFFRKLFEKPERPVLAILGGKGLEKKLKMMDFLLNIADDIVIGGEIAYTFLKHTNRTDIGDSFYTEEYNKEIDTILSKAEELCIDIHLPYDFITGKIYDISAPLNETDIYNGISSGEVGLDIGGHTVYQYTCIIATARTIVWNGALGTLERDGCDAGSTGVLQSLVHATDFGATTIIVGEDLARLCQKFNAISRISHVTMGKAGEKLLMGGSLPGVSNLLNKVDCHCRW